MQTNRFFILLLFHFMKDKGLLICFSMSVVLALSSCATMISGTKAEIMLNGEVDEPVNITTSDATYTQVELPITVKVKRRHLNGQRIKISSESYAFNDIVLKKSINEWTFLNPYFVTIGVDMLTNAVSKPEQDVFYITPVGPSSMADSIRVADSLLIAQNFINEELSLKSHRHELNVGLGFGPNQADADKRRMIRNFTDNYSLEPSFICGDIFGDSYILANIEYHYRLNRKWDIGALVAWGLSNDSYDGSKINTDPFSLVLRTGYERCLYFVAAPSLRYTWYEDCNLRLYSRSSLGLMRHHLYFSVSDANDYHHIKYNPAYQITAIGGNVGLDAFRIFVEVGYGFLGLVRFGAYVSF